MPVRMQSSRLSGNISALTGQHPAFNSGGLRQSRGAMMMLDAAIVALSCMVAYLMRFEGAVPTGFFRQMLVLVPVLALARVLLNYVFGLYRVVWRYVGLHEALKFAQSVAIISAVMALCRIALVGVVPQLLFPLSI